MECNAKFQVIQSANEVLTDPQQRAKYDAQRMRAGLLHTYTGSSSSPTRPSVPTRSPMADFPPPPRPPPYNATKNNSTSHSSGAQRYKDFRARPETTTWRGASTDDPKAKTSDFKAWESMRMPRRGEGPIPSQRRTVPPKATRPPPVPARETNGKAPKDSSPRRSGWDHLPEPHAGMPGTTRADTGRGPTQKNGFAPSTPGAGDEPQARSAYFTVGRGDRPGNTRPQTHMPPPPHPGHVPTSKRPDPLAPFKDKVGLNEPFGKKNRVSTPYQTGGGEKISPYFTSPRLERSKTSASPRDSNSRTGWYEGKSTNADSSHHRAASASSNYQTMSASDKKSTRIPGVSGVYSSSSSSSSSSDEDVDPLSSARPRVTQVPKTRRTGADAGQASAPQYGGFNPFAKAGDEPMAPHAGLGTGGYEVRRRHSAMDMDTRNPSEGFLEHRKKHEAEQSQQQSTSVPDASDAQNRAGASPPLQRSHSWHHKSGSSQDKDSHPGTGEQEDKDPMYEPRGYNPFPSTPLPKTPSSQYPPSTGKWSDQWPFNPPKKPRTASAENPPYWAIPSSLPPPKVTVSRKRASTDAPLHGYAGKTVRKYADIDSMNSFKIPGYAKNPFPRTESIRSQSSENIDTKFSPDNWHGKFFERPPLNRSNTPRGVSPPKANMFQQQQEQEFQQTSANGEPMQQELSETSTSSFPPPPPPFARGKFQHEQWAPHLNNLQFDIPQSPQGRSPSRTSTRKRARTRPSRASNFQPSVDDAEDDPTASSATGESVESSKASSDADAMDVDNPTPPPAKKGPQLTNGGYVPAAQPDVFNTTPRQTPVLPPRSPAVQPRANDHGQPEKKASHLNLGDMKNVYPFAPSNEGLGNMSEMGTTLPQSSHASPTRYSTESSLQRMKFPNPPLSPSHPHSLTQHSWDHYCLSLRRYVDEWTKFNDQMAEILKSITRESVKCDWSEPEGKGYDKHMAMLNEHHRARVHLEVACENNEKCMRSLGDAMDEKVRGRGGVGRKQSNAGPVLEGLL